MKNFPCLDSLIESASRSIMVSVQNPDGRNLVCVCTDYSSVMQLIKNHPQATISIHEVSHYSIDTREE